MNQADMNLVAAVEAHIAAKDARITELTDIIRSLWAHEDPNDWQDEFVAKVKSVLSMAATGKR